jgi:hypothetical protein
MASIPILRELHANPVRDNARNNSTSARGRDKRLATGMEDIPDSK